MTRVPSHVIGFDDGPFPLDHRGDVLVVGAVFTGLRLEGVLSSRVRRDGANATRTLVRTVACSRFAAQIQAVMLQGIAMAGFNVVDLSQLHEALAVPVLAIARRPPDLPAMRRALLGRVPGGARKWALIESLPPMEPAGAVLVQRLGLSLDQARTLIERTTVTGAVPEPIRVAHLIAGGIARGHSRGRA